MHSGWNVLAGTLLADLPAWWTTALSVIKVVIGFSLIIIVHELGHFLAAKWVGIRVDRFAIGFLYRLVGWRRGEGLTFGERPEYTAAELAEKGYGETDYCLKALPLGGYVKMLGQEDIQLNEETGEITLSDDPRSFTNKPVGARMLVVSSGVLFNLIFAIAAFMCVYMMGKRAMEPRIGLVAAGTPAALAGVRSGDLVLEVNGKKIDTYRDLLIGQMLAEEGRVRLRIERDGTILPQELELQLEDSSLPPHVASGLSPFTSATFNADSERLPGVRAGDRITHVAGHPVADAADVLNRFQRFLADDARPAVELTIEQRDKQDPQQTTLKTVRAPVYIEPLPTLIEGAREAIGDSKHILGLCPRLTVEEALPGQAGQQAGLKHGDVVAQWDTVRNPLFSEVVESIHANANRPIPIVLLRDGQPLELTITPKRPFKVFRQELPKVGVAFGHESGTPVIADVAPNSPASHLNIPRGAQITAIDGQQTASWFDVLRILQSAAGQTVLLQYRSGQVLGEGELRVPSSIVNELQLPPLAQVRSVNGRATTHVGNRTVRLPDPNALRALLAEHAGETVTVEIQRSPDVPIVEKLDFAVAADASNANPWQMLIGMTLPPLPLEPATQLIRTSNPFKAAQLGLRETGLTLMEIYQVLKSIGRSFSQGKTGTAEHVAGPVGIIAGALDRAKAGFPELLFFLAFLSVNLAVLNFLPFPVVDGGLMVFLIIEKLRGKPLSVRAHMIATAVGLATIVLVFLLVTFKDITRILS
jgi:regulator of sigma E protease